MRSALCYKTIKNIIFTHSPRNQQSHVLFSFLFLCLFILVSRWSLTSCSTSTQPRAGRWTSDGSAIFLFFIWRSWFTTAVHPHCTYMYLKKKQYQVKFSSGLSRRTIVAPKGKSSLSLQEPDDKPLCSTAEHYAGSHASMSRKALAVKTCRREPWPSFLCGKAWPVENWMCILV